MEIDGTELKRLRLERFYSMRELAQRASVTHETVMEIERGDRPRSQLATIRKLAEALGVAPASLVKEQGDG